MRRWPLLLLPVILAAPSCRGPRRPPRVERTVDQIRDSLAVVTRDSALAAGTPRSFAPSASDTVTLLVAGSTSPWWRVDIMQGALRVRLDERDVAGTLFPPGRVDGVDSNSVWTTSRRGSGLHDLTLRMRRQECRDPGVTQPYPYRVDVTVDGRHFTGCAVPTGRNLRDR
jgi:uncharacterized membrane protein